jgi:hypothetical protein
LPRLESPRFYAVHPTTGRPVANGQVTFYYAGTTTLRPIWVSRVGGDANLGENPHPLDAAGSCEVYLSGAYRIAVEDANGNALYDADYVNSISAETEDGNTSSLLAANNLSDLTDTAAARDAIGLPRQSTATDATSGRALLVGAFGLGGTVPEISASGALSDTATLVTGWRYVALANVATVGGPSGAGAGVCEAIVSAGGINQAYYPLAAGAVWRRFYASSVWSSWVRDVAGGGSSNGANGRYDRFPSGLQICQKNRVVLTQVATGYCEGTWTFEAPFANDNYSVSYTLRPTTDSGDPENIATGADPGASMIGQVGVSKLTTAVTVVVLRDQGQTDFGNGDEMYIDLTATGEWI